MFHLRGYRLPGFYEEVCSIDPSDGSTWTNAEKDQFRKAMFKEHKNMWTISKLMNKPVKECLNYYLGKFKQTKDYQSLKDMMRERKANLLDEMFSAPVVCVACGNGGKLIVCDTCESHYHLSCTTPPLATIPEGSWNCIKCNVKKAASLEPKEEDSGMGESKTATSCGKTSTVEGAPTEPVNTVSEISDISS